jgi:hypothetical protein
MFTECFVGAPRFPDNLSALPGFPNLYDAQGKSFHSDAIKLRDIQILKSVLLSRRKYKSIF